MLVEIPIVHQGVRASLPKRDRTVLRRREWSLLWELRTWNSFSSPFPGRGMSGIRAFWQIFALSSEKKRQLQTVWRRERDSNPRSPFGLSGFQDRLFQPLTHPSAFVATSAAQVMIGRVRSYGTCFRRKQLSERRASSPGLVVPGLLFSVAGGANADPFRMSRCLDGEELLDPVKWGSFGTRSTPPMAYHRHRGNLAI